jgi:hypothetical protein
VNGLIGDDGLRSIERTIASGAQAGMQHPRGRHYQRDFVGAFRPCSHPFREPNPPEKGRVAERWEGLVDIR